MDAAIKTATMPARPLMPSMMFKAWVQPPTATMVKSRDTGQKESNQSAHCTSTRTTPPNNHQAMAAEIKAANNRLSEPTSLLMSSTTPATKTGRAAINKTGHSQVRVILPGPSTNNPAKLPAQMAKPPTRGAGRKCEAWGLSISVSPVKRPCQRSESTMIPPTTKATTAIDNQVIKSQVAEACTSPPYISTNSIINGKCNNPNGGQDTDATNLECLTMIDIDS